MKKLPDDLKLMACCMYNEYLNRKSHGCDRSECRNLSHEFFSKSKELAYIYSDFDPIIDDLSKRKLIKGDILGNVELLNDFLIMMESEFKGNINAVLKSIKELLMLIR